MFLEKAKVQNFRGIRSLAVDFEENSTFLIGENQWGKTSFLKALWMVLGKGTPCKFEKEDLYVPIEIKNSDNFVQEDLVALVTGRESLDFESNKDELDEQKRDYQVELKDERHLIENLDDYLGSDEVNFEESDDVFKNIDGKIKIDLYFKESIPVGNAENHKNLKNYWYYDDDGFYRIHYQVVAFSDKQGNFVTYHNLIDKKGMYFKHDPKYENAIQTIIDLNPIFRLRIGNMGGLDSESVSQERIRTVLDKLNNDEKISAESVGSFVSTFSNFFEKYFADYFLHNSDITFDFTDGNKMTVHNNVAEPWKVTLVDTGLNTMTGGRIKRVRDYIGNEPFMLTYGDGVSNVNIKELVEFHKNHGRMATISVYQPNNRFGVVDIGENNIIKDFREKTKEDGDWINAGFMVMQPEIIDLIEGDSTVFERFPLEEAARRNQLCAYKHTGFWQCMDTMRDKQKLEELWNSGNAPWKVW